jgi:hypothetical protein
MKLDFAGRFLNWGECQVKRLFIVFLALCVLSGCESDSDNSKPEHKAPEFITGRAAFQKLYISARGWAPDALPFLLQSQVTSDCKGQGGKVGVWSANFASPAQHSAKSFVWSGTDVQDAPSRGVTPGPEDSYNPSNSSTQVFDIAFIKVDSDAALETAQKHGGEKLLAKSPDTPMFYVLEWSRPSNVLIWHVIYGASRDDAKLRVAVNATTGEFIRVEK